MEKEYAKSLDEIIFRYDSIVKVMENDAREQDNDGVRAYGGVVRSLKGRLQEYITHSLILLAWEQLGGDSKDLEINSKKIHIPIKKEYLQKIDDIIIKKHIEENIDDYHYGLSVDKHVFVKDKLVLGIECKAYTENAMLKRILVDFDLLSQFNKDLSCFLFQLESQLGGDYSKITSPTFGSTSSHTIMSYFDCKLNIITLLEGERNVDEPIHKFFKPLSHNHLLYAKNILMKALSEYV